MTTIRIPLDAALDPDQNHDGRVTFRELLYSTLAIIGLLLVSLNVVNAGLVVTVALAASPDWTWRGIRTYLLVSFWVFAAIAVIVGAVIGIRRQLRYERQEAAFWEELHRRRQHEDEDRARMYDLGDTDTTRIDQARIDEAAWVLLAHYYRHGTMARGKVPGISETLWNEANEALKRAGIRRGRRASLEPDTLAGAWGQYIQWKQGSMSRRVRNGEPIVR